MKNPFRKNRKPLKVRTAPGGGIAEIENPNVEEDMRHYMREANSMAKERAPHNPHQALITVAEQQLPATELVAAARSMPAMVQAVGTIAHRFEQFVQNIDELNKALGQFKQEVMLPFKDELKYLRYTTGDRLNHVSTDLEKYVQQLDKTLWAALRAQGMSDEAIKAFRTENGMEPEAPRGFEIETHIAKVAGMQKAIEDLTAQNKRLIAAMDGRHQFLQGDQGWVWRQSCKCTLCKNQTDLITQSQQEALIGQNSVTAVQK